MEIELRLAPVVDPDRAVVAGVTRH